jgi:hypothetical protein
MPPVDIATYGGGVDVKEDQKKNGAGADWLPLREH